MRASSSSLLFCIFIAFYKTYFSCFNLFRTFLVFPFISCLQNLHFSMIILPDPTIGFFKLFSSFYNRYKPVNRSIHAFATFTKNQEGVRALGYKIQKYVAGKYTRARAPLARKYTTGICESKDGTANTRIMN